MSDEHLDDSIDNLEQWLDDLESLLAGYQTLPLPDPVENQVDQSLLRVEAMIQQILDAQIDPSLSPPNVGEADTSITALTLHQYAQTTHQLAIQASAEIHSVEADHAIIGSHIKTIQNLLTGFRDAAGIG